MRHRSQTSVEYLALLVGVLLISIVVANLVLPSGIFNNSGPRSQFYWSSSWPFSIESYTIIDGTLVLNLHNGADDPLYVTGIRVAGAEHPLFNYSTSGLGGALCTEGPVGHYTCGPTRIGSGKNRIVAASGFDSYCTFGVKDFVLDNLSIEYTQGSITGVLQSSNEKLAGSCGQQAPTPTPTPAPGQVYITGCRNLNRSGDIYILTADATAMPPSSSVCFNITTSDVILDMNGYRAVGNNTANFFGVWTASNNSIVKNGNLQNFSVSIYSQGNFTTLFNNVISVPANSTPSAEKWQGIELAGNSFGNVSFNAVTVSAVGPGAFEPAYPNGIFLLGARNSTFIGNNVTASGVANGIYMFANAATQTFSGYNSFLSNNLIVSNGQGLLVNSSGGFFQNWNNFSLNAISSTGAGSGASLQYANNWGIAGNAFKAATISSKSLFLVHSNYNSILANSFSNSTPASFFVYLADASYNNLAGNTLSGAGLYLGGRNVYNNITGNAINTSGTAIQLVVAYYSGNLSNNNFSFNTISSTGNGILLALTGVYNNTFFSNSLKTAGIGIQVSSNVTSAFFDSNTVNSTINPSLSLMRYSGFGTGNSTATFRNDKLSCTTCASLVVVNSSSSATFTNVSFDRSKITIGNDEAFGPNNITVQWYADVNVRYANGTPAANKLIALSDSLGRYMNATPRTDSSGAATIIVPELFSTSLSYYVPNGTMEWQFVNYSWNTSAPGGWVPSAFSCTMYNSSSRVHSGNSSWYINSSVGGLCYPYANLAPSYLYAGGTYLISGWFYNASPNGQASGRVNFGLGTGNAGGNIAASCSIGTGQYGSLPYGQWVYRNTTCVNPGIINGNQAIVSADIDVYGPAEIYADDLSIVPLAGAVATDNLTYVTYNYTPHQFEVKNAANTTNNWTYAFITNPSNFASDIFVPLVFATNASGGEGGIASGCMNVTENMILVGNVTKPGAYNPLPGQACINITADNVVLDCNGAWISGNDNENTAGIWTARNNVTVKNCNVQNFSYGIFSQGVSTSILNNSVYVPMNSTVNAQAWQGIELKANKYGNVSGNSVYAYTSIMQTTGTPPYRPDGILLWNSVNSTVSNNSAYSYGNNSVAINIYSSSNYNNISRNFISTNSSSGMGVYIYASCTGNNIYSNVIGTSGSNGYGVYTLSSSDANNIYWNSITTSYSASAEGVGAQAIYIQTGNNTIYNNSINTTGAFGYGIWISGASASWNKILGNTVNTYGAGSFGSYLYNSASFNNVTFNVISTNGSSSYGFYLRTSANNNSISSNNIVTNSTSGYGIYLYTVNLDNIFSNIINTSGSNGYGVYLYNSASNNTVSSNAISTNGSAGYGVYTLSSSDANSISWNNITTSYDASTEGAGAQAIYLQTGYNAVFSNNINTSGNFGYGIWLSGASANWNNVTGNSITTSGLAYGLYGLSSSYNNILSNTILTKRGGSHSDGIGLVMVALYNNISFNTIVAADQGVSFGGAGPGPYFNNVLQNSINSTGASGIRMQSNASFNNFSYNNITGSGYGMLGSSVVMFSNCFNNSFYSNRINTAGSSPAVGIGYAAGSGNESATFANDVISCYASCTNSVLVNNSGSAVFTNVSFNRTKVSIGSDIAYGPNNLTVLWPLDVFLANNGGNPRKNTWANVTSPAGLRYSNITGTDGVAHFAVAEFLNVTNSSGNYLVNYTPHAILALDNSNQTAASTSLNVTAYQFVTMKYN